MRNLQLLRKENNINQEKLSKYLKVSRNTISQYETGVREPNFETLIKLADYFNVSIDYLLGRTTQRNIENVNNEKLEQYQKDFFEYLKTMNELECFQAKAHIETLRKMQTDKQQAKELYNILKRID